MMLRVGDIRLKAQIAGRRNLRPERMLRNALSGFRAASAAADLSLNIFVLPPVHLDAILLDEEKAALKHILGKMSTRFPYAKFPYEWVTGYHRKGSGDVSRPGDLPAPFVSMSGPGRFSVVPLRQYLLVVDHTERQATAIVRGEDLSSLLIALTRVIQAAFCMTAPEKKALMLHGAAAEMNGEGYLFLGVSGAGKSTLAGRFPGPSVFSDESSLCFLSRGRPLLAPTPFTQAELGRQRPEPAPLKKILFLKKDAEDAVSEMSPGTAMARILHNHIHFFSFLRQQEAVKACGVAEAMVRGAPASSLHFTRRFNPLLFFKETVYERKKAL